MHRILLEQVVLDSTGRWLPGPHVVGWLERASDGVKIRLVATRAAETARALLEEDLLDVMLSNSYPALIQLTTLPTSAAALT